jgi:hypothetical protein
VVFQTIQLLFHDLNIYELLYKLKKKTVSRGPANLRDEYFRLLPVGVQSRRILERLNNARAL